MKKTFFKIISVIVSLFLIMVSSVLAFAKTIDESNLSYTYYFSEERLFEDLSLNTNSDFVTDIDDSGRIYRYSNKVDSKKNLDRDILYQDIPVLDYAIVENEIVFATNDQKIHRMNLNGNSIETMITLPKTAVGTIDNLYADKSLIWFRLEDTVYRFHRKSGTLDNVYTNKDLIFFRPISNFSFTFDIYSEEWIEYIKNGGNSKEIVDFHERETFVFDIQTQTLSEYSNDDTTKNNFSRIDNNEYIYRSINHYTNYSAYVRGKHIPYSNYPIGAYLNDDNGPCTHHTTSNNANCSISGSCGCKKLGSLSSLGTGIQCNGFAKEIYGYLFGKSQGTYFSDVDTSTTVKAKNKLMDLHPGAYIKANGHSLILIKTTSTYADFYHANYELPCKVSISSFEYSDFKNDYPTLEVVYDGLHYFLLEGNYQVCQYCGYSVGVMK